MIPCKLCQRQVGTASEYIRHLKTNHALKHYGTFICPKCNNAFHRMNKFKSHLQNCIIEINVDIMGNVEVAPDPMPVDILPVAVEPLPIEPVEENLNPVDIDINNIENNILDGDEELPDEFANDEFYNRILFRDQHQNNVQDIALKMALKLHSKPNFTRSDVYLIQQLNVQLLLTNMFAILGLTVGAVGGRGQQLIDMVMSGIQSLGNEYLLTRKLIELNLAKDLEDAKYEFLISNAVEIVFDRGEAHFDNTKTTGMLMPLYFQIKEFLSRNNRLKEILDNLEKYSLPSNTISHITQGSTWKKIVSYFPDGTIVIPFGIYTDDMQFNNPCGPHQDSTDMLYCYYPGLTDPFHSNNIHLAAVIRSKYIKSYGSGRCLISLVQELCRLFTEGIDFEIDGEKVNVKIVLCQIIGDNLGMNAILDYILGFNKGNFFCRICKASRAETQVLCEELITKLRNRENYQQDLLLHNYTATGITNDCIFNMIPYFHCTLNLSLDLMHDFFEGIIIYDICQAIIYFIGKGYFTLKELNDIISSFRYGKEDARYIPGVLKIEHLEKNTLKMTARETWQFFYLFPIYIGHKIPEDDEVWSLILTLLKIIETCLRPSFQDFELDQLQALIKTHNTIYQRYFGSLKPKMHLITHLPTSIRAMGPPRYYMCFRMESMHRFFKIYAHCMPNRKNIAKSFAKKYALHFANILMENQPYLDIETEQILITNYPQLLVDGEQCFRKSNFRGTEYDVGMFIPKMDLGIYTLYEILEIVVSNNELSFICKKVATLSYVIHYQSYALNRTCANEIVKIQLKDTLSVPVYIYRLFSGTEVIRPKIFFNQI